MSRQQKLFWGALVLILIPFALAAILYPGLPEKIPTHFNINGTADAWGGKASIFTGPAILGVLSLLIFLLISNIHRIDPMRYGKVPQNDLPVLAFFIVVFMTALSCVIIYSSINNGKHIDKALLILLGTGFAAFGFYMPKLTPNYFVGLRLPWTLNDPDNWAATHQLAGRIWTVGGMMIVVLALLLSGKLLLFSFFTAILIMVIWPVIFSYRYFSRKVKK